MSIAMPSPKFTPAELTHFNSLQTLLASLSTASRDPQTPPEARELLLPRIGKVSAEIQEMNEIALGRDTVNLKAEAEKLLPATTDLKLLKAQLAAYAEKTAALQDVAGALDQVLSAAQALGI